MNKVTFLINSLSSGGAEKVLSLISNELVNQNYDVEIIFLENNHYYQLSDKIKVTYLSNLDGKQSSIKSLLSLPILAYRLKKYINAHSITMIQSHMFRSNYVNLLAKVLGANHKIQVVTAGRISRYLEIGLLGKVNLWLIKKLYPKADVIISKAKGMQADMQELFHFDNNLEVINNPYNVELIEKKVDEKITDFKFNPNKKYIVSVGRLIKLKRNIDVISALSSFDESVEVLFIGQGSEKENLKSYAKSLGVLDRIHFLGQVENPFKYIAKSNIFVNASESEGFPNVLVEAMVCKIPVVSSDCVSGPREIIAPQTNINERLKEGFIKTKYGTLYATADVNALVKSIKELLQKDNLDDLKSCAYQRSLDFSMANIIQQYKKVLEIE